MTLKLIVTPVLIASACMAACLPVTTSRITGRDLAAAEPGLSALPANYTFGIAPEPGARRLFTVAELERIAAANHIARAALTEVCFEVPLRHLRAEDFARAMKNALPSDADVKVIEISQADVPVGEIEFPTNALEPVTVNSGGVQLWRGSVHYAESRKMPIWARVSVTEHYTVVVAARDLNQNSVAPSNALRLEERTGPPPKEKFATRIADVAGKQIVRFVKTGDPIPSSAITEPWDVKRGDPVRVEVRSGDARLSLDGIAESSAREGDMLDVRNPSSGKLFRARLEQGSRAVVIVGPGPKL